MNASEPSTRPREHEIAETADTAMTEHGVGRNAAPTGSRPIHGDRRTPALPRYRGHPHRSFLAGAERGNPDEVRRTR